MSYQFPLVEIIWDDASSDAGWQEIKITKFEPQTVISVGFLIAENSKYLIIGHTYSGDDFVGWMQIPKGMIISKKILKRASKNG